MKAIIVGAAVWGMQGELRAAGERVDWQEPQQVLAAIEAGTIPSKPNVWQSPRGPIVLHGDLFGDGRHLALVGTAVTTVAAGDKDGWKILASWETAPAWVPVGKSAAELGYDHCQPPEVPFVLKDLDGDRVPEVLVAFNNDGYQVGYRVGKKDGAGFKFLSVRSERGEPERLGEYLVMTTATSGRKSWWSGVTYSRWEQGEPRPVATWVDDSRNPESRRMIAVRHAPGREDLAFEIVDDGDSWTVKSCRWDGDVDVSDVKDLAKVSFVADPSDAEDPARFLAEESLIFEMTTAIPGSAMNLHPVNREGFDFARSSAGLKAIVNGTEEARKLLKRLGD